MELDVTAEDLAGGKHGIKLLAIPNDCPRCHRSVHPKHLCAALLKERGKAQVTFRCTNQKCQEFFLATYYDTHRSASGVPHYAWSNTAPIAPQPSIFPETVCKLSPTFVIIFEQAIEAEGMRLDQLVGIGLRKALEFLVKDYAVAENAGKEQEIRESLLSACINKYISDENVKQCAKRAAWLGNDETHYTRKWETRDVSDLKLLVRLTVNWIDNCLLTRKYLAEMDSGKV